IRDALCDAESPLDNTEETRGEAESTFPPLRKGGSGGVGLDNDCKFQIENCKLQIEVAVDEAPVGGGSVPGAALPTAVVRLRPAGMSVDELARCLRRGRPAVFGRIQDESVLLDLRSV